MLQHSPLKYAQLKWLSLPENQLNLYSFSITQSSDAMSSSVKQDHRVSKLLVYGLILAKLNSNVVIKILYSNVVIPEYVYKYKVIAYVSGAGQTI